MSPAMRHSLELCQLYADAETAIIFVGPVGVGKTTLAREVHRLSGREGPFVATSAGELTENLHGDVLFGHVPGAYTDARGTRRGAFARAAEGTLLIDDFAVMPTRVQATLLKVLESGRYQPLGSEKEEEVRCQLLFASTVEPRVLAESGTLMIDLASRLGELIVPVLPLEQRRQDIMPIAEDAAAAFLARRGLTGVVTFSDEVKALFQEYSWPTNVRELRHVTERAVIHAGKDQKEILIRPPHLPERLRTFEADRGRATKVTPELVRSAVEQAGGNQSEAARQLGVHRNTVARHLADGE